MNLIVDNIWTYLKFDNTLDEELLKKISEEMSYTTQEYVRYRKTYVNFTHTLFDKKELKYPTGLYSNLERVLSDYKQEYNLIDKRKRPQDSSPLEIHGKILRGYQEEAVEKAIGSERGIIKIATGGGKTVVAAGIISKLNLKTLFVVNSIDLLEQTADEFDAMFRINVGRIGGGSCDIKDINVCTIQTLFSALGIKYQAVDDECKIKEKISKKVLERKEEIVEAIENSEIVICDESQHLSANSYVEMMKAARNSYYKFGLSATPQRYDGTDLIIDAYAGKQIINISASYLIDKGFLVPPKIYFLDANEHSTYKYMRQSFQTIYKEWIVGNDYRNDLIVDCAERLLELDKTVLITVTRIPHGQILLEKLEKKLRGINCAFMRGEVKKDKRKELLNKVRNKELNVLIGTSLEYNETIWIKDKFDRISLMKIGEFVDKKLENSNNSELYTLSYFNDKICWKKITHVIRHETNKKIIIARIQSGRSSLITEDHSLISYNNNSLKSIIPKVNKKVVVALRHKMIFNKTRFNLVKEFYENFNHKSIEIKVNGITQAKLRLMKTEYEFLIGKRDYLEKKRIAKFEDNYYREFIIWFNENVKYHKGKYRTTLKKALKFKYLDKLNANIFWRRSRKNFELPLFLDNSEELAKICGMIIGDGSFNYYRLILIGKIYNTNSENSYFSYGKENIREEFIKCMKKVFPNLELRICEKGIAFGGLLIASLFKYILNVEGKEEFKKVPNYIFNSSKKIQMAFLYGYYLSDGTFNGDYTFRFVSVSKCLIDGCVGLFLNNNIKKISMKTIFPNGKSEFSDGRIIIPKKIRYDLTVNDPLFGLGRKTKRLGKIYYHGINRINDEISNVPIKKIFQYPREFIKEKYVYDISVQDSENFFNGQGILCHNSVADEGLDLPALDSAIMAGGGKSLIKSLQRVGRTLRPYPSAENNIKKDAIIIDFYDRLRYLTGQSKKRMGIYRQEPRFEIFEHF